MAGKTQPQTKDRVRMLVDFLETGIDVLCVHLWQEVTATPYRRCGRCQTEQQGTWQVVRGKGQWVYDGEPRVVVARIERGEKFIQAAKKAWEGKKR